eukprot:TRINITY_DN3501_c0_g1_i1.p1 TRINITY_DN3501_c0_g1~~TRINITY_DN3501_c0_g1_i1.p1  ORF type:complete len:389 (-),score=97.71 TRINITY_DN3501_c0_g1_i1:101-1237(-)
MADNIALLTPYKFGPFDLSHRIVYAPLTRCRAIGTIPHPSAVLYYTQRATKGGFMLTEGTCISQQGQGYPNVPGIHSEAQVEGWKPIVKAVKDKGAIFFCQLWHVGRASHYEYQLNGAAPVSVSSIPISSGDKVYTSKGAEDYPPPRALEISEIKEIVKDYVKAAENAKVAGFDGVEIHSANGYLLEGFIREKTNNRTDEYGGSIENRARLVLEIVDEVIKVYGADRIGIRFSPYSEFLDMKEEKYPVDTYLYLVEELNKRGILYAHFVESRVKGNDDLDHNPESLEVFRKAFKGTFIAAGGYKRESGIEAVETGHADLVTYGRIYLANPDLPRRFELNAPLNKYDRSTFYIPDHVKGYTDYPFLDESFTAAAPLTVA